MKVSIKKIAFVIIASLASLLLLASLGWFIFLTTQFSVYQDDQYKFSIKYPTAWALKPHLKPQVAVVFVRPKDTAMDMIQENFNVTIQPLPSDLSSLDGFTARVKKQMLGVFGKQMKLVIDRPLHWGWRQGYEISLEERAPNHLMMINAWVLRSNEVCILTFLGDMTKGPLDGFLVDEMIRSFKLQ